VIKVHPFVWWEMSSAGGRTEYPLFGQMKLFSTNQAMRIVRLLAPDMSHQTKG
jgi:hypothetical protein